MGNTVRVARFRFRIAAAVAALVLASIADPDAVLAQDSAPNVVANRYEVLIGVQTDGSLDVTERIALRIGAKPITWFERKVSARRTDGITNVVARIGNRDLPRVTEGEGARIKDGRALDVRWQFAEISNTTVVFELRYRALHVVERGVDGVTLWWDALPERHAYPIESSRVDVHLPPGVRASTFAVTGGNLQAPAGSEDVAVPLVATAARLERNEGMTLDIRFVPTSFTPAEAEWQVRATRAREMAPALFAGGATLVVIAIGIVWMVWLRGRRPADALSGDPVPAEADQLPPAVASALVNRGRPTWYSLQAAFFRLVRDGQLIVEKRAGTSSRRAFDVRVGESGFASLHEAWIIDAVRAAAGADLRRLTSRFVRRQRAFSKVLRDDVASRGYLDADREATSRGLRITGLLVVLLAIVMLMGLAVFDVMSGSLGPAVLAIPAGLFVGGLLFIAVGASTSTLSDNGVREAARWRLRATQLRDVIKAGAGGESLREFERWFPFAIGAGLGGKWLRAFSARLREDGKDIEWMRLMGSPEDAHASLAMMVAMSGASNGASGAGAGGGGAAGGGSSAAG
jgi:hypothetical protein